jgi:hypothetical protein
MSLQKKARGAYTAAVARCTNPTSRNYHLYGGRGIKVLLTEEEFIAVYLRTDKCEQCGATFTHTGRHVRTIDRLDRYGHYEIGNVQVACRSCNSTNVHKKEWQEINVKGSKGVAPEVQKKKVPQKFRVVLEV